MMIELYTDGGARGNPGPAGAGAVIYKDGVEVATVSEFLGVATNNVAEYEALRLAFEKVTELFGSDHTVTAYLDSELIVKQMKGVYRVKNPALKVLHEQIKERLKASALSVSFQHVRREKNKRADALANEAMDRGR